MTMRLRVTAIAFPFLLGGCAIAPIEHYDPAALRASALEREAAGDASTARVLRARANRLAPHATRAAPAVAAPPPPAPPPPGPADLPPEPPALWPSR